jgi:predicted transcriptional regulator
MAKKSKVLTVRVTEAFAARLDRLARKRKRSRAQVIRLSIEAAAGKN